MYRLVCCTGFRMKWEERKVVELYTWWCYWRAKESGIFQGERKMDIKKIQSANVADAGVYWRWWEIHTALQPQTTYLRNRRDEAPNRALRLQRQARLFDVLGLFLRKLDHGIWHKFENVLVASLNWNSIYFSLESAKLFTIRRTDTNMFF